MNSNQDILDSLLRHKILLLGFSKQVAEQVITYLKETEPEIRALLIKQFGVGGQRLITRLRETEVRLRDIRRQAWKRAAEYVALQLLEMAEREHLSHERTFGVALTQPVKKNLEPVVVGAVIAGHTLGEWFDSLEAADTGRAIAQLRIGVIAGDSVTKLSRRMTGRLSLIGPAAYNAVRALSATAFVVVSDAVRNNMVAANPDLFDYELWVSIIDSGTTKGCFDLHLMVFPVGEGPQPGYHLHCRSDRIPLNNDGGKVAVATYGSWIVTQPQEFQSYAGKSFKYVDLKPIPISKVT